jgi:hypothetical protein
MFIQGELNDVHPVRAAQNFHSTATTGSGV